MKKAVSEMHNKSVPDLIQDARRYVTCMTGNPDFTTPDPPLADITAKALALEAAYEEAKSGEHAKKAEVRSLTLELKHLISFLTIYVNIIAKGDEQKIFSSGMKVSKEPEPAGLLPEPDNLKLDKGPNSGKVKVRWNKVPKASSYEIDYYEADDAQPEQPGSGLFFGMDLEEIPWEHAGTSTSTKFVISGLKPGNRILVRVAAVNTEGAGTWSDPATIIIP